VCWHQSSAQREQAAGPGAEALNNDPRAGPLRATRAGSHEQPENRSAAPASVAPMALDARPAS
jgi:hypothetical protein